MWNKIKWYCYAALAIAGLVAIYLLFKGDDDAVQELNEWMFDKRVQLVKEQIDKQVKKSNKSQEEIHKVEVKLEELEAKRKSDNEKIDKLSIVELKELYKDLHR